jgi:hypothetical protein
MMSFVFPVIGTTEWSGGSWMPTTQTHRGHTHAAIDIYAAKGQTIVSPVSGYVKASGSSNIGGNWVQIEGRDGNVYYFAHMAAPTQLEKGQQVGGGMAIGTVGNTGSARTTSPHLHFSVRRDGKAISPVPFLQSAVVVPDISFTGDAGGSSPPWAADPSRNIDEPLPAGAQQETPAWFDQLNDYRAEMQKQQPGEEPLKQRSSDVMRASLYNMSRMVQRAGFATEAGDGTGIDDGMNTVTREAGRR